MRDDLEILKKHFKKAYNIDITVADIEAVDDYYVEKFSLDCHLRMYYNDLTYIDECNEDEFVTKDCNVKKEAIIELLTPVINAK